MKIKALTLQNIRSYADQTVEFPDGTILIRGDNGAGKTSLLMGIFGGLFLSKIRNVRTNDFSLDDLVRRGEGKGTVKLGNHPNKTGGGLLSVVPGLSNGTMPDLPSHASNVAKGVTSTIGNAFGSVGDFVGGVGSFFSDALPVIGGPEQTQQPVNQTNSTE